MPRRKVRHDGLLVAITRVVERGPVSQSITHSAPFSHCSVWLEPGWNGFPSISLLLDKGVSFLSYSFVCPCLMSQSGDDELWGDFSPSFEEQLYNKVALAEQAADLARQRSSLVGIRTTWRVCMISYKIWIGSFPITYIIERDIIAIKTIIFDQGEWIPSVSRLSSAVNNYHNQPIIHSITRSF